MASDPPKGWNDPPVLSYGVSDSPSRKPILNKRVPFPSSGLTNTKPAASNSSSDINQIILQASQNVSTDVAGVPLARLPPPPPCLPVIDPVTTGPNPTKESIDKECLGNKDLQKDTLLILTQCLAVGLKTLQKRTADDIERRLGILSNMWSEGKLNEDVQIRMHKFSEALKDGDYDQANNIHMSLIVDHPSQVTPWMVGIKHLIHELRNTKLHPADDKSCEAALDSSDS